MLNTSCLGLTCANVCNAPSTVSVFYVPGGLLALTNAIWVYFLLLGRRLS